MQIRNLLYALTGGVLLLTASCSRKTQASRTMGKNYLRIMSYNIHHANPPSKSRTGEIELDTIAAVIRLQHPDIVALQEVDDHTERSGAFNEAEEIARKTGMHFYFAKAIDYGGGGYGVGILSRYPLTETNTLPLPSDADPGSEHRVLAIATVTFPGGLALRFACTHLDVKSAANRSLQMQVINRIAAAEKRPFIIAGDLNDTPGSPVLKLLDSMFQRTCTQCGFTIPAKRPSKTIDHIAFTYSSPFTITDHQVIPERYASDHLPVVSVLEIK